MRPCRTRFNYKNINILGRAIHVVAKTRTGVMKNFKQQTILLYPVFSIAWRAASLPGAKHTSVF